MGLLYCGYMVKRQLVSKIEKYLFEKSTFSCFLACVETNRDIWTTPTPGDSLYIGSLEQKKPGEKIFNPEFLQADQKSGLFFVLATLYI